MNVKSQQDPALLRAGHARHVPHAEDHGRLASAGFRIESALEAAPILESRGPRQNLARVTHCGKAWSRKAQSRKAQSRAAEIRLGVPR